ncbi:MAG: hypothetical protein K6E83_10485 [Clostridium sp.]|nr:hypothetical protein [Clostridium sp.]
MMRWKKQICLLLGCILALLMACSAYADNSAEQNLKYEGAMLEEAFWDYSNGKLYAKWEGDYRSKAVYGVDLYQDGIFVTTKTVVGGSYVSFGSEVAGRNQTGDYTFTVRAQWPGMNTYEKTSDTIYIEDSKLEEIHKRLAHSAGSEDPGHRLEGPAQGMGSWKKVGGNWRYLTRDGIFATNGWMQIDGKWYWFDESGNMAADRWINKADDPHVWYYVGPEGDMLTNQQVGEWFVDANGECRA